MKKYMKYIILIVCIMVIVVIYNVIYNHYQKDIEVVNEENNTENLVEENIIEENIVEQANTVIEEDSTVDDESENFVETNNISDEEVSATNNKEEAIKLVKQKWGEDNTVTFRCDSITSSGEYIIAVVSKNSAIVKNYFKVDLLKRTVEVDY